VARWEVLGGDSRAALAVIAAGPRHGFETGLSAPAARYVAVRALDAAGTVLGTSRTIRP
jgi:hypothetical protein